MHPPTEQLRGGERGVALPALQHAEGILESGAEERGVAGVHGVQVRHRTGVFLRGHLRCFRALTQLPGGGNNRQVRAHVEPCQTPVVQLFQAEGNKLFEQVWALRGAVGAEQVGGEQFQLQLASGVRFGLVCFAESVGGGAGRDLMVQERAGAFLHVGCGNGVHGGVPVPVDCGAGGGLKVSSFSEGGVFRTAPPAILRAVPIFEDRRTLNLRHNERIQLGSVVAVEFAGALGEHDSVGARVVCGARLHPFFEVVEGGCLHLRVGVAERHNDSVFAGGSVKGALPVQRLEHGQDFECVCFGSGAYGGCRVGEGGGIQRLRVFAPETVNMLHAEGHTRADGRGEKRQKLALTCRNFFCGEFETGDQSREPADPVRREVAHEGTQERVNEAVTANQPGFGGFDEGAGPAGVVVLLPGLVGVTLGEGYVPVAFDGEHTPDELFTELFVLAQQRKNQVGLTVDEGGVVVLVVLKDRAVVEFGKPHGGSAREPARLNVDFHAVLRDGSGLIFADLGAERGADNVEVLPAAVNLLEGAADRQNVGEVTVEMHDVAPGFLLPAERVNDFAGERLGDDTFGESMRFGVFAHGGLSEGS